MYRAIRTGMSLVGVAGVLIASASGLLHAQRSDRPSELLRFSSLPMVGQAAVDGEYTGMLAYLREATDLSIVITYRYSYESIIGDFIDEKIDLAVLGPLPYVQLTERVSTTVPLVRFLEEDGSSFHTCSLVRFGTNSIDLYTAKEISVALTDPLSTCGNLGVEELLNRYGRTLSSDSVWSSYVGSQDRVAVEIALGHFDIGGVKTDIGEAYSTIGLERIAESEPFPGFVLVANAATVGVDEMEAIRSALLLDPLHNEEHAELTQFWGPVFRNGAIPAHDQDYDDVRGVWTEQDGDPVILHRE